MSKKITLNDLMEKTHTFNIVHPKHGKLDATITIRSTNSDDYFFKQMELSRKYKNTNDSSFNEQYKDAVELMATAVVSWDESFFGKECTSENVFNALAPVQMAWLRDQIAEELVKTDNFFPNS